MSRINSNNNELNSKGDTITRFIKDTVVSLFSRVNRSNGIPKLIENKATIKRVIKRCLAIKDIVVTQ